MSAGLADLAHEFRPARHRPQGGLVLLHGRAVSERDLLPLLDVVDPDRHLVGIVPRGPLELPPGGYHWYKPGTLPKPDAESFRATFERLSAWLAQLAQGVGVPQHRMIVGGFSQGAAMALALAFGPERPRPAGLICMSGYLPEVDGLPLALEQLDGLPVVVLHGTEDPVMPIDYAHALRDRLTEAGADVTYRESAVPHAVDPAHVPLLREWVSARFPLPTR